MLTICDNLSHWKSSAKGNDSLEGCNFRNSNIPCGISVQTVDWRGWGSSGLYFRQLGEPFPPQRLLRLVSKVPGSLSERTQISKRSNDRVQIIWLVLLILVTVEEKYCLFFLPELPGGGGSWNSTAFSLKPSGMNEGHHTSRISAAHVTHF